jgi:hypothetical protein
MKARTVDIQETMQRIHELAYQVEHRAHEDRTYLDEVKGDYMLLRQELSRIPRPVRYAYILDPSTIVSPVERAKYAALRALVNTLWRDE